MDRKPELNIPIIFQKLNHYDIEDTRFMQVKIWIMHLGENLNGSYFEKSVVEDAISSLPNTPILAYIEDNSDGDSDFSDHRMVLIKDDGQYKVKYIGQAIGVIPETNNAQFEMRVCDDGVEREFLTVDGLLWTKFDDPIDIMNRDKFKAESMELHEDYEGEFREDNLFHFTKFKFYGACGLGKSVLPAMQNASIEMKFSFEGFQKEIQTKMEQFKQFSLKNQSPSPRVDDIKTKQISEKEDGNLDEKLELLKKYNLTPEKLSFSIEELNLEEIESKIKEQFSLSNSQLMTEINKVLQTMVEVRENYWGDLVEVRSFYLMDLKDSFAIVVTYDWDTYFGIPYTVDGDIVTLDFEAKIEYIPDWRPKQAGDNTLFTNVKEIITSEFSKVKEETATKINEANEKFAVLEAEKVEIQGKLDTITTEYSTLETEAKGLREFKATKLKDERSDSEQAIFTEFEDLNNIPEYEQTKKDASKYKLEDLTEKCFAIRGKKNSNFSLNKKEKTSIKINFGHKDEEYKPYGDLIKE
jgi:hypothetical protein